MSCREMLTCLVRLSERRDLRTEVDSVSLLLFSLRQSCYSATSPALNLRRVYFMLADCTTHIHVVICCRVVLQHLRLLTLTEEFNACGLYHLHSCCPLLPPIPAAVAGEAASHCVFVLFVHGDQLRTGTAAVAPRSSELFSGSVRPTPPYAVHEETATLPLYAGVLSEHCE